MLREKKNVLIVSQYSPPGSNETAAIGVSPSVLLLSFSFVGEMHNVGPGAEEILFVLLAG